MIIEPGTSKYLTVYGTFKNNSIPSVEFRNKAGVVQNLNIGRVRGTFAEFFLSESLLSAVNLPATVKFKVDGKVVREETFTAFVPEVSKQEVSNLVAEAVEGHVPGIELGYAERLTTYTTTNTAAGNAAGLIGGLSVTFVATGRPVDVEFYAPAAYHQTINTLVAASINQGNVLAVGTSQMGSVSSPINNNGPALRISLRTPALTKGQSYTYGVHVWGAAAGQSSIVAAAYCPMQLKVTAR